MTHCVRWLRFCACLTAVLIWGQAVEVAQEQKKTPAAHGAAAFHTIKLEATEVTQPALAVSADGKSLVFSMLGHLFQVPAAGGAATQLTTGFSYDSDPAVSPDGKRLAFVSDRDGSGGNVFVLDLSNRQLKRLTHELEAGRPVWSPDGSSLGYCRYLMRDDYPMQALGFFGGPRLAELCAIPDGGGTPVVVAAPDPYAAFFYLPDGRLSWAKAGPGAGMSPARKVLIEARSREAAAAALGAVTDDVNHAVVSPKGDGIYYSTAKNVKFFSFSGGNAADIAPLSDGPSRLAVARDGTSVFFGDRGQLWRVKVPGGAPERIAMAASVTLEVRNQTAPKWTPPGSGSARPRAILSPQISPDGHRLVFMAAGFLWEQPLDGGPARRLFDGGGFERDPAFSPDGRKLAFVVSQYGSREYDFETRQTRTLYTTGGASWPATPGWSPDGTRIVFQRSDAIFGPFQLISVNLAGGKADALTQLTGSWTARPQFSRDDRSVYFTARRGKFAGLYRLALEANSKPEPVTALTRHHVNDGLVSPDGKWVGYRRNSEIWIAPFGAVPIGDSQVRRLSTDCSRSFSFTPDSSAIVYSAGDRVWRQPLPEGKPVEIPIRLTLQRTAAPPLIIRRVRVLNAGTGRFGEETSILISNGRIDWIGTEQGRQLPKEVVAIDGGGRYAIPGLSDVHVHSAWANELADADAFIAFGITSVRDVGGSLDLLDALRDRSETTDLPVPRYFYSGEIFEGAMPMWGDAFLQIANEEEARQTVRKWKNWDADFIKVYPSLPWHLQAVVADEAQRSGMPLVGHAISFEEMLRHAVQGYASVEHTTDVMHDDARKLMAATGTRWIATLTCEGGSELFMHEQPERLSTDLVRTFVPADKIRTALGGGRLAYLPREMQRTNMKSSFARVSAAYRDGVRLRAGTDALMSEVFFGLSLHWEIEFFSQAGLSQWEALRMATAEAAETVGATADLGALAPGRLADLVLLDANPLENIQNTLKIWRVVKSGRVFNPQKLRPVSTAAAVQK